MNNMQVSSSMGVSTGTGTQAAAPAAAEEEEEDPRFFKVQCVAGENEGNDPTHTYTEPMCGAVLSEAGTYDSKTKNALIVRVSSAGMQSTVQKPIKVDDYNVEIPVSRNNMSDLVEQLIPAAPDETKTTFREMVGKQLTSNYGAHFDYDMINNAFKAMVPESESWTVEVSVQPPFQFGKMSDTMFFMSPGAVDAFAVFPLLREQPVVNEQVQVINFGVAMEAAPPAAPGNSQANQ